MADCVTEQFVGVLEHTHKHVMANVSASHPSTALVVVAAHRLDCCIRTGGRVRRGVQNLVAGFLGGHRQGFAGGI